MTRMKPCRRGRTRRKDKGMFAEGKVKDSVYLRVYFIHEKGDNSGCTEYAHVSFRRFFSGLGQRL